jgi:hypothetical protein
MSKARKAAFVQYDSLVSSLQVWRGGSVASAERSGAVGGGRRPGPGCCCKERSPIRLGVLIGFVSGSLAASPQPVEPTGMAQSSNMVRFGEAQPTARKLLTQVLTRRGFFLTIEW